MGTNAAYEPFEYKTASGEIVGFDIDIANALCEQLKRKCVFVESEFDSVIPGLQARKFDVIISSISITPERQRVVDFTTEAKIMLVGGMLEDTAEDNMRKSYNKNAVFMQKWLADKGLKNT